MSSAACIPIYVTCGGNSVELRSIFLASGFAPARAYHETWPVETSGFAPIRLKEKCKSISLTCQLSAVVWLKFMTKHPLRLTLVLATILGCQPEFITVMDGSENASSDSDDGCEADELDGVCVGEWVADLPSLSRDTHVSISAQLAAIRDVEIGDQVRIERSGGQDYALFTVAEMRLQNDPADPWMIGMNEAARLRLGVSACEPEFCAHLVTKLAPFPPEFEESLVLGDGRVLILAPHGGDIENHTDEQAQLLAAELSAYAATVWICEGYSDGGGAFSTWHIPSFEISVNSFPLLDQVDEDVYEWAVSFHGFSGQPDSDCNLPKDADPMKTVIVGGLTSSGLRILLAAAIEEALNAQPGEDGFRAIAPIAAGPCNAQEPSNIVNRFTIDGRGGIQIESGPDARNGGNAEIVATMVADVLAQQLGNP